MTIEDRKIVSVNLVSTDEYSDWPPENLVGAIEWLQRKLEMIPEGLRRDAVLEIDAVHDYEDAKATIDIGYARFETDDEVKMRLDALVAEELARVERVKRGHERELRLLERLVRKHGWVKP